MPPRRNLIGQTFGRLTVMSYAYTARNARWWCRCECDGRGVVAIGVELARGHVKSCGCWQREVGRQNARHGMSGKRLYNIWRGMKQRCEYPPHKYYKDYGARGVSICEEWHSFDAFMAWANANGYDDTLTIDRVNVDGNYEPANCRWITNAEQQLNKRKSTTPVVEETAEEFYKDTPDEPARYNEFNP